MKYFKLNGQVFAFSTDGSEDGYILPNMVKMTDEEIDRHLHPEKYMTDKQKREEYLKNMLPIRRFQFKMALLELKLLENFELAISNIVDTTLKVKAQIQYQDSDKFERLNPTLLEVFKLAKIPESQIDLIWEKGIKL